MYRLRKYTIFFLLFILFFLLLFRLFHLQVISSARFSGMAEDQHNRVMKIEPRRGAIYDRFMEPLAINLDASSVYADPRGITDKAKVASGLSAVLGLDEGALLGKLGKDKSFVWVKRKVGADEEKKLRSLRLEGVYFMDESKRNYPNDTMASQVVGFAGIDNNGLEGLELYYDNSLKGEPGWRHLIRDARRRTVLYNEKESIPPRNGYGIVLTIDSVIQCLAEEEIWKMAEKFNASGATCIVMEPSTGKILAMANYPPYNLNAYDKAPAEYRKNPAVSDVFEPGSVFKIVTASAVLEEGAAAEEDIFDCENGEYPVRGRVLHDYHPYGNLAFRDVIAKSSNIGTVKSAMKLGDARLYDYIQKFGFGENTGIDLPGEVSGISRPPKVWSKSDITTIPIGQGIAVTPIQMACAVSVVANGGYLVKPYVVDSIVDWRGEVYKKFQPVVKRRVLSEETCEKMHDILHEVVVTGTGTKAAMKNYEACGKTGTAQMVNPSGGYFESKYYATFIGFAPKDKPLISIVVSAKDPHPAHFGGTVAAPAFRNIAEGALQYLESNKSGSEERAKGL